MTDTVESMIEEIINEQPDPVLNKSITKPMNLMKLRKTELLKMATSMNCMVTSKNTKAQIVAAIEKQSA